MTFRAACLQVTATEDMAANIDAACALTRRAVADGAQFVSMPENVALMTWGRENILSHAAFEDEHPALAAFQALAQELGVWLHIGSLTVLLGERVANRTYVIDPDGEVAASYDKIHLFDVFLSENERYHESETVAPGASAEVVDLPWGKLGLSICYDLRFPQLYRTLAKAGAEVLTVPAAFTKVTGEAHWHVLLRARAIENGAYVLAAAQTGNHAGGRQTYGHALIVDPWGEVLADAGTEIGYVIVDIDPAKVAEARKRVPSLHHDRPFF